jgi:prepilin-type N-terminal cleavage/methylation domain-containing protein/prepilin-type processing-associated H-X9-DG protein
VNVTALIALKASRQRRGGFTLVEILVVIAIIAILAALLGTGLSQANARHKSIQCKNNERQLVIALALYELDFREYPFGFLGPDSSYWFNTMAPYLGNAVWGRGVLKCPAYKFRFSPVNPCGGSYAFNDRGTRSIGDPHSATANSRSAGLGLRDLGLAIRLDDVKMPSDMYAFGDSPLEHWNDVNWNMGHYYFGFSEGTSDQLAHPGFFNMSFVDGHVESVKTNKLWWWWGASPDDMRRWNTDHEP